MYEKAILIVNSNTEDLKKLAIISGNDPKYYYFDANFNGVDIRGQDLEGLDFSSAKFSGVRANALTKVDIKYKKVVMQAAMDTLTGSGFPNFLLQRFRERDPEYIALLAAAGEIEEAVELLERLISSNASLSVFNSDIIECGLFGFELENRYFDKWFEDNKYSKSARYNLAIFLLTKRDLKGIAGASIEFMNIHMRGGYLDGVVVALFSTRLVFTTGSQSLAASWIRKHARNDRLPDIWMSYLRSGEQHFELDRLLLRWLRGVVGRQEFNRVFWLSAEKLSHRMYRSLFRMKIKEMSDFGGAVERSIASEIQNRDGCGAALWNLLRVIQGSIVEVNLNDIFDIYRTTKGRLSNWASTGDFDSDLLNRIDDAYEIYTKLKIS